MNIVSQNKEKVAKEFDLKEVIKNVKNLRAHLKAVFKEKTEIKQNFLKKLSELQRQSDENQKWFEKK